MKAEDKLNNYKSLTIKLKQKEETIEQLKNNLENLQATIYSKDRVTISNNGSKLESDLIKMLGKVEELTNQNNDLSIERCNIINCLHQLENANEMDILYQFYIEHKTIKEICKSTYYSRRQVQRIKANGLKNLETILSKEFNNNN